MKVKIKKPVSWVGPYQIARKILFWLPEYEEDMLSHNKTIHGFGEWLSKFEWLVSFCEWIHEKRQKYNESKICIDDHDIWSLDYSLSLIILPALKKIRECKHGAPNVLDEDVPDDLKTYDSFWDSNEGSFEGHKKKWDYVLDEMIFAFECISKDDSIPDEFFTGEADHIMVPIDKDGNEVQEDEAEFFELTDGPNHTQVFDQEGFDKYSKRIDNGLRLFSVYYRSLWT